MKKFIFIISVSVLFVCLAGCGKKQQPIAEMQEPISIEELGKIDTSTKTEPAVVTPEISAAVSPTSQEKLAQLPPAGPYKPSTKEIQRALANAGYYTGLVDGKVGPLTKTAIEEFQKANALKIDGKVGPNTWVLLSAYLNPVSASSKPAKKR